MKQITATIGKVMVTTVVMTGGVRLLSVNNDHSDESKGVDDSNND